MSSGAEHYTEAERLLDAAAELGNQGASGPEHERRIEHLVMAHLAAAQVHATLAKAAAAAYPAMRDWAGDECSDGAGWARVTAPAPRPDLGGDE